MSEKHIMLDLNDPRSEQIAEVLTNKSAKKIISLLAEEELSEGDIAKKLGMPLNSVGYNVKKLLKSGLIKKSSGFFWSSRGKKIPIYAISNKKIVISPKSMFKGVVPALLISGAIALGIWKFGMGEVSEKVYDYSVHSLDGAMMVASEGAKLVAENGEGTLESLIYPNVSLWFLFGALTALFIFLVWNWRKVWK